MAQQLEAQTTLLMVSVQAQGLIKWLGPHPHTFGMIGERRMSIPEMLGFDPTKRPEWDKIGVDPDAGITLVLDARVTDRNQVPVPIILAKVTSDVALDRFIRRMGLRPPGYPVSFSGMQDGPDGKPQPIRRGAYNVTAFFADRADLATGASRFYAFMDGRGAPLSASPTFRAAMREQSEPALFWIYAAPAMRSEGFDHVRTLFPALGAVGVDGGLIPSKSDRRSQEVASGRAVG